jgi:hypothetical protein
MQLIYEYEITQMENLMSWSRSVKSFTNSLIISFGNLYEKLSSVPIINDFNNFKEVLIEE